MKKAVIVTLSIFCAFICVCTGILIGRHTHVGQIRITDTNTHVMSAWDIVPRSETSVAASDGKININTATSAQLQMLPNIGKTIAQRIVDYRTNNGAFQSLDDLLMVDGIGEKRLEEIRKYITVGGSK